MNIDNEGVTDQEVGITYLYGEDVDTSGLSEDQEGSEGPVDATLVNNLFEFELADGGEKLSPDGTEGQEEDPGQVTVEPGENQIHFNINLTSERAETLADAADVSEDIFDDAGVEKNLDLLDSIRVGLIDTDDDT